MVTIHCRILSLTTVFCAVANASTKRLTFQQSHRLQLSALSTQKEKLMRSHSDVCSLTSSNCVLRPRFSFRPILITFIKTRSNRQTAVCLKTLLLLLALIHAQTDSQSYRNSFVLQPMIFRKTKAHSFPQC
jgi:hypothetical protein